jgi:hypothetical protein
VGVLRPIGAPGVPFAIFEKFEKNEKKIGKKNLSGRFCVLMFYTLYKNLESIQSKLRD